MALAPLCLGVSELRSLSADRVVITRVLASVPQSRQAQCRQPVYGGHVYFSAKRPITEAGVNNVPKRKCGIIRVRTRTSRSSKDEMQREWLGGHVNVTYFELYS